MLKILFFIETLGGGGAEKVLIDLVNHMDQSKFDITVETLWPAEAKNRLAEGIRYRSVYKSRRRINQYRMRLESALGLTYRLHMKDDYDIEVAYLECGTTKILSSSTNKRAAKIAWVHCDLAIQMANNLDGFVKKAATQYKKFDKVVCVSEDVLNSFRRLFGSTPPACVLHNTVDDKKIKECAELPLPRDAVKSRTTVVTLGRLTYQKAYDRLLEAHRQHVNDGLKYDLWILGEGEERTKLEAFVKENDLQDTVRFFGFQSNPYPFIKAADLLVCSSRYEGFSTFVTEGLLLGKPIVTTDCTGMRELLGDSEYGFVVENSTEGLYSGISYCLSGPNVLAYYSQKAMMRGTLFSAEKLTGITESFFEDVASKQ